MPEGPEVRREARARAAALVGVPIERIDYRYRVSPAGHGVCAVPASPA